MQILDQMQVSPPSRLVQRRMALSLPEMKRHTRLRIQPHCHGYQQIHNNTFSFIFHLRTETDPMDSATRKIIHLTRINVAFVDQPLSNFQSILPDRQLKGRHAMLGTDIRHGPTRLHQPPRCVQVTIPARIMQCGPTTRLFDRGQVHEKTSFEDQIGHRRCLVAPGCPVQDRAAGCANCRS